MAVCFDQSGRVNNAIHKRLLPTGGVKELWMNGDKYPDEVLYPIAGKFIKYLIDKFGRDKILLLNENQTFENALNIYREELSNAIKEFEMNIDREI